nr:unnamed protein product [Spirometra erinaceieuropaei]
MGHVFNFDAVEIVGRGDDHTARQVQEVWMSTGCSVNRLINLPPPSLTLRTFLTGHSHGAGQSEPPTIVRSTKMSGIQVTVTRGSDAATQVALVGQASNKVRHTRRAGCMTSQSLKMDRRNDYSKRQASNTPLPVNASFSFHMPPGNRIFTTIDLVFGSAEFSKSTVRLWKKSLLQMRAQAIE